MEISIQMLGSVAVLILVLFFFGFLAFAVLFVIRKSRANKERLAELGFEPLKAPDPALYQKIIAVHHGYARQKLAVRSVFRRGIPWGDLYIFDLVETGGSESSYLGSGIMGLVSSELHLPFFQIMPQPNLFGLKSGFLAETAEKILQWGLSKSGLIRVRFPEYAQFDSSFLVAGCDEDEVRQFFTERRINGLLNMERHYQIEAGNDLFTINRSQPYNLQKGQTRTEVNVELMLSDIKGLMDLFQ